MEFKILALVFNFILICWPKTKLILPPNVPTQTTKLEHLFTKYLQTHLSSISIDKLNICIKKHTFTLL